MARHAAVQMLGCEAQAGHLVDVISACLLYSACPPCYVSASTEDTYRILWSVLLLYRAVIQGGLGILRARKLGMCGMITYSQAHLLDTGFVCNALFNGPASTLSSHSHSSAHTPHAWAFSALVYADLVTTSRRCLPVYWTTYRAHMRGLAVFDIPSCWVRNQSITGAAAPRAQTTELAPQRGAMFRFSPSCFTHCVRYFDDRSVGLSTIVKPLLSCILNSWIL